MVRPCGVRIGMTEMVSHESLSQVALSLIGKDCTLYNW